VWITRRVQWLSAMTIQHAPHLSEDPDEAADILLGRLRHSHLIRVPVDFVMMAT
jgi:hypothetical protein